MTKQERMLLERARKIVETRRRNNRKYFSTERGKKVKSFNQRIYSARKKGDWEKVARLLEEKRRFLEG